MLALLKSKLFKSSDSVVELNGNSDFTVETEFQLENQSRENDFEESQPCKNENRDFTVVEIESQLGNETNIGIDSCEQLQPIANGNGDFTLETEFQLGNQTNIEINSYEQSQPCTNKNSGSNLVQQQLKFDYHTGVSPFMVAEGQCFSNWWTKGAFLFLNFCSVVYIIMQIRIIAYFLSLDEDKDKRLFYVAIGHQLSILHLQLRFCFLLYKKQNLFVKLFSTLGSHQNRSKVGNAAIYVRLGSIVLTLISLIGGLNVLRKGEQWSFETILDTHVVDVGLSLQSIDPDKFLASNNNSDFTFVFSNKKVDNLVLASVGITLELLHEIVQSCPNDLLLLSSLTLWHCVKDALSQLDESDCKNEAEMSDRNRIKYILQKQEELENISKQLNQILDTLLPSITMTNVFKASYFIQNCLKRNWYQALSLSFDLTKTAAFYMSALRTSAYAEKFHEWFTRKGRQRKLDLDAIDLQIFAMEMSHRPVGIGTGVFYIDMKFITSYIGITSSYFFTMAEASK